MNKRKLGEISTLITDGSHNPPMGESYSDFLMLSSKNIFDDCITLEFPRYLTEEDYEVENQRTHIEAGDILLTIVGTVGRCAVVPKNIGNIVLQRSVAVIKPKRDICYSRYLMYSLIAKRNFFEEEARGVAQKGIYLKQLAQIELMIHDMEQQRYIMNVLDHIKAIINMRNRQLSELDTLIKARFVEMFGDMITNPNGWGKTLLGEACDVRDGTHDSPKYFTEGYPLVTSKNVTGGKIDFTDCSLICEEDYNAINQRSKVDLGDILMPMIGTVGNPVIVGIDAEFAIKNVALIKFKQKSSVLNSFVKALLESDYFDRAVISKVRGGTQKFISLGDIRKLEICLPPIAVQEQFADFVQQVDKSKFINDKLAKHASKPIFLKWKKQFK